MLRTLFGNHFKPPVSTILSFHAVFTLLTSAGSQPCVAQTVSARPSRSVPKFDSLASDYSSQLPRLEPVEPSAALETFEVLPGFRWELVASEPLVFDPVAMAFDARERLFVAEMSGYSEQPDENRGVIALLEDTDRDGKFDRRTEYATGLSWPTAIWPWRDGVLVAHAPRLTWFRDIDDDGKSDQRQDWFSGFGRSNVQGLVNSLRWSPRAEIVGATSSAGAKIDQSDQTADNQTVTLRGRDFAIDPVSRRLSPRSGGGQHGLCENDAGDRFVTSNSDHLQQAIELERTLQHQPAVLPLPRLRRSIAVDGPQAEVFRISPVEPWRTVRTRLRKKGMVPGPVEGGGRAAGYFTGATGTCFLNPELGFGQANVPTALVCDVGSNLIHRKSLRSAGLFWSADRMDLGTEMVRSRDTWFRPVQLQLGPGGAVYVADMYRETIEHPKSLPPVIKKHLDLTSGRDRGRIYRLVPESPQVPELPVLATLGLEQLVTSLTSADPWKRRMASQLIVEKATVENPLAESEQSHWSPSDRTWKCTLPQPDARLLRTSLENLATTPAKGNEFEAGRILASHLLQRFGWYNITVAAKQLRQPDIASLNSQRRLAYECLTAALYANQISIAEIRGSVALFATTDAKTVEGRQASQKTLLAKALFARAVGQHLDLDAERMQISRWILSEIGSRQVDEVICWAIAEAAPELIEAVVLRGDKIHPSCQSIWLNWLLPRWLAGSSAQQFSELLISRACASSPQNVWLDAWANLPAEQTERVIASLPPKVLDRCRRRIVDTLRSEEYPDAAVSLLILLPTDRQRAWIASRTPQNLSQQKWTILISMLRNNRMDAALGSLLNKFEVLTPAVRRKLAEDCMSRKQTRNLFVAHLSAHTEHAQMLPIDLSNRLIEQLSGAERDTLTRLLRASAKDRQALVREYTEYAVSQDVTPERLRKGLAVFTRHCASCHRLGEVGHNVGPPLRQLGAKSFHQLITAILDPSREVDPRYEAFQVLLDDGTAYSGLLTRETDSQLTLRLAEGRDVVVTRDEIDALKSSGKSLMPEGFEQQISRDQMLSLLSFLQQSE